MRLSQITKVIDKDEEIVVHESNAPRDQALLYCGKVRGIRRDNPINKMHVTCLSAEDDVILVLVERSNKC